MVHLGKLQQRLNKSPELQKQFLKNPVKVLADEGIELSKDMAARLRKSVAQLKKRKGPAMGSLWQILALAAEEPAKKSK
jgi:hypothetical protein